MNFNTQKCRQPWKLFVVKNLNWKSTQKLELYKQTCAMDLMSKLKSGTTLECLSGYALRCNGVVAIEIFNLRLDAKTSLLVSVTMKL